MTASYSCRRCGKSVSLNNVWCASCESSRNAETSELDLFYRPPVDAVQGIKLLLAGLKQAYPNLDLSTDHFTQTPHRVARMFIELCWGLGVDPKQHLKTAFEESNYDGIVLVSNIGFTSLCMHHFAIFRGVAHVGYIPRGRIVGLSKINRVVEIVAARPQVQEQVTYQIADIIDKTLKPKGVAVVVEGTHDCIEVRGVRSKGSVTKTSEMRGVFLQNSKNCKDEFFSLIRNDKKR